MVLVRGGFHDSMLLVWFFGLGCSPHGHGGTRAGFFQRAGDRPVSRNPQAPPFRSRRGGGVAKGFWRPASALVLLELAYEQDHGLAPVLFREDVDRVGFTAGSLEVVF